MTLQSLRLGALKERLEMAQRRVDEQAARLEKMAADGLNTAAAEHLLTLYLSLTRQYIEHTERVGRGIRDFSPADRVGNGRTPPRSNQRPNG